MMRTAWIDLERLQDKFATLICLLHMDLGMSLSEISGLILSNDYFDFLERNEADRFMNAGFESIAERLFGNPVSFDYRSELPSEVYWAAYQLIHISISTLTPIKRVVLLFPLERIVSFFEVYHEMNEAELVKHWRETESRSSVIKAIGKPYKVRQLSSATDIPAATLNSYSDNRKLFNASFSNIDKLSRVLDCPISLFRAESAFVPLDPILFKDEQFVDQLCLRLSEILPINNLSKGDVLLVGNPLINKSSVILFPPFQEPEINDVKAIAKSHRGILATTSGLTLYKSSARASKGVVLDGLFFSVFLECYLNYIK
ncbi:MAG: hypothetical protein E7182_06245 [Erysipelotrichaceae bacterium]|nr:hypothetical protein [Erysipelotrichaceae bacterium]